MSHTLEERATFATDPPPANLLARAGLALYRLIGSAFEWLFGVASALVGLAVLAALPVVQFLTLGYLLEASGRVARSGRLRDAFIGIRIAARVGGIVLCGWLLFLPARFAHVYADAGSIVDPTSPATAGWRLAARILVALTALHVVAAVARDGRVRHFLWPFTMLWMLGRIWRGGFYSEVRDRFWAGVDRLRLPYYFWLGLRGFVAAFVWLAVPVSLFALGSRNTPLTILLGYVGAALLMVVLLYLPFLQARLAMTNRFGAAFELSAVRSDFRKAPWAFSFATVVTLLFALPLFLLKIEVIPREAAWLPSLVFLVFIFPARVLTGWALSRAKLRETPRHWFWRWLGWLPVLPVVAFYVLIVFFTQYTSWNGVWSLYEQHPFLLPVPFVGM